MGIWLLRDGTPLRPTPPGELTVHESLKLTIASAALSRNAIECYGRRNADARTFIQGAGKALLRVGACTSTADTVGLWWQSHERIRRGRMPARSARGVRVPRQQQ